MSSLENSKVKIFSYMPFSVQCEAELSKLLLSSTQTQRRFAFLFFLKKIFKLVIEKKTAMFFLDKKMLFRSI